MARALAIAERIGDPLWISIGLINVAWLDANRGDWELAFPMPPGR